ncbi:MAG: flagellar basal body rod protein FlgC [Oscillospiraceae bacterium]|jgi:flagellar basal-body rod protein FlgC|nr:flagellar basal body rod protein FlgC [Oscillospiraceae bacterium]
MSIFRALDISASALTANRYRMDVIGENIANADTTRTATGGPYRRKYVIFQERSQPFSSLLQSARGALNTTNSAGGGVKVIDTREDESPFKLVYDPEHPDADADGYVSLPNVDMEREMVDMIAASRAYEANITVINNFKTTANQALQIGR